jgi:hypothetical protein
VDKALAGMNGAHPFGVSQLGQDIVMEPASDRMTSTVAAARQIM